MKRFNLLFDQWIPVKTSKGKHRTIRAYEIVQGDLSALDAPRADFNAALMQFLIGLLQTALAPKNPNEWRNLFKQPPTENELMEKYRPIKSNFYLDGDGCRFMQDVSIKENGNAANVIKLIPGVVGDNTIKKNQDFFFKSSQTSKLSISNIISALYLYQNYCLSEAGGKKALHHGSFRGRNTFTVFIFEESGLLWQNLWLNVLQDKKFKSLISSDTTDTKFEWVRHVPYGKEITDSEMTLQDIYWSMPRRVWIDFSDLNEGICDLTANKTEVLDKIYIKENGIKYATKLSRHPLIPYSKDNQNINPIKLTAEGVTYGDWLAFVGSETASENLLAHLTRNTEGDYKVLVCGYLNHSQQAKTLCWYQTMMPVYGLNLSRKIQKEVENEIAKYILACKRIAHSKDGYLSVSIRMAWFGYDYWKEQIKKKNKKPDPFFNRAARTLHNQPIEASKNFWKNTEDKFYALIKKLYDSASYITDEKKIELKNEWYLHIKDQSIKIFDRWAFKSKIQTNPRRIAIAHNQLLANLNSKKLKQEILGLPEEVKK
jgi:CRISPR system Cascade subunit CasA